MQIPRAPERPKADPIVALIDVVFFLLVFFMLIGRMDATAPFAVLPPIATTGMPLPAGGMTLSIGADGALALDGTDTTQPPALAAIAERMTANPTLLVRINADGQAALRHVFPLVAALEKLGATDVALVVTPADEDP